jgi:RNA polymerase sigma-70 factor (ECF subfamily)
LSDDDGDLLRRCRQGDEAAWRELVARHTRRVFGLAYRFTGRGHEAEDLTQEVFLKVYQSLDRYDAGAGSAEAWIMTVARNHAIDRYRRGRAERERRVESESVLEQTPSGDESAVGRLERDERVAQVQRGLRSLPPDLRVPVVLCDIEGESYDTIARRLGVPLGTVKSRINRGRLELAKRLRHTLHEVRG